MCIHGMLCKIEYRDLCKCSHLVYLLYTMNLFHVHSCSHLRGCGELRRPTEKDANSSEIMCVVLLSVHIVYMYVLCVCTSIRIYLLRSPLQVHVHCMQHSRVPYHARPHLNSVISLVCKHNRCLSRFVARIKLVCLVCVFFVFLECDHL